MVYDRRRCHQQVSALTERRYSTGLLAHDRMKIRCMIGTAHQRAGRDVLEAFLARDFTEEFELFRRDVFYHWQVLRTGPKILPHGKDLHANIAEIIHRLKQLRLCFTQPKHHAAFCHHFWRKLFCSLQDPQGCPVFCA